MSYIAEFDKQPWDAPAEGLRTKVFENGGRRIRLLEFSHGYVEPDWCYSGHMGYVLDGEFGIDYDGGTERYKKGDVILIPGGAKSRHMPILREREKVTLLLFEKDGE